eukprot:11942707-Alexandrium_andersonii.AAC.1
MDHEPADHGLRPMDLQTYGLWTCRPMDRGPTQPTPPTRGHAGPRTTDSSAQTGTGLTDPRT